MVETPSRSRVILGKLGLKLLALLLGIMAWYLIQDAIRIESAQRHQVAFESMPAKPAVSAVILLPPLPIMVLSRPGVWEWHVDPPAAAVWLEGPSTELDRLEKSAVRLFVDGTVISQPGEYAMLPVKVHLPPDVRLKAETDPVLVRVALKPALKGGP